MKTWTAKTNDLKPQTYLLDASGKTLGRLATRVSSILIGKGKKNYTPGMMCGDQVVVINAEKIYVTGKKTKEKMYKHYTGYPDGLKEYSYEKLQQKQPEEIILRAVARMLPNNKLGREMLRRLRVYAGTQHRQQAQKPITI